MTFSNINVSNPNDGLGDKLRNAFIIVNDNFASIGTIVDADYITATLSNYATKTYVDNIDAGLQDQVDFINNRLNTSESDIDALETNVNNLTLSVNGKASLTQLNNSIANINDAISAQQNDIDNKIDDAPNDGFIYGRQNGTWVRLN